ncbi:hypothetical protein ASF61_07305 [Duganella sp. Leaf126]|nr:hypothetical protein ASF61_07305 [Duganella sp. Leaf126]
MVVIMMLATGAAANAAHAEIGVSAMNPEKISTVDLLVKSPDVLYRTRLTVDTLKRTQCKLALTVPEEVASFVDLIKGAALPVAGPGHDFEARGGAIFHLADGSKYELIFDKPYDNLDSIAASFNQQNLYLKKEFFDQYLKIVRDRNVNISGC